MTHNSFKKFAAVLILLSFIFATVSPAMAAGLANITDIAGGKGGTTGDAGTIYFGSYWQSFADGYSSSSTYDNPDEFNKNNYNKEGIKWRVLATDAPLNPDGSSNKGVLLLSDQGLYADQFNSNTSMGNTWCTSEIMGTLTNETATTFNLDGTVQTWGGFAGDAFSAKELAAIADTTHTAGGSNANSTVSSTDKIFLLSYDEAMNTDYGFTNSTSETTAREMTATDMAKHVKMYNNSKAADVDDNGYSYWWLRSPGYAGHDAYFVCGNGDVVDYLYVNDDYRAARSALNLNQESVLFASAAEGGKSAVAAGGGFALADYDGSQGYKLTLKDDSVAAPTIAEDGVTFTKNTVSDEAQAAIENGTNTFDWDGGAKMTTTYADAVIGTNMQLSALLYDRDGNMINYAKIADTSSSASGTAETTLANLKEGKYKTAFYSEQANGDYQTDYAGALTDTHEFEISSILSKDYRESGLAANVSNGAKLGFESAKYDTVVSIGADGGEVYGGTTIAELNADENTTVTGFVNATKATIAEGKQITTNGAFVSDKYVAIGKGAVVNSTAANSAAIGSGSVADAANATAIGSGAIVSATNSVALGSGSVADEANVVSVGNSTTQRKIVNVASGGDLEANGTNAVNIGDLYAAATITGDTDHNYYTGTTANPTSVKDAVNAVDSALGKTTAGNYIAETDAAGTNTIAAQIDKLDAGLGAKIEADGNVIKKSETNTINQNISALDTAIGDMSGFDSQNYAKDTTNVAANLTALDTELAKGFTVKDSQATPGTTTVKMGDALTVTSSDNSVIAVVTSDGKIDLTVDGSEVTAEKAKSLNDTHDNGDGTTTGVSANATEGGLTVTTTGGTVTETTTVTSDGVATGDGTNSSTLAKDGLNVTDGTNESKYEASGVTTTAGTNTYTQTADKVTMTDGSGNSATMTATGYTVGDGTNSSTLTATQLQIGGTIVDGKGITSGIGDSQVKFTTDGISAGGQQIANVGSAGDITGSNTNAINGADLYSEVRPADGTYVRQANTTAQNLTALDTNLAGKADKTYVDGQLALKANAADVYTKTAVDTALAGKQDALTAQQMLAVNSGITAESVAQIAANADNISTLQGEMTTVKGDVSTLKTDMTTVKSDVSTLKTDVTNVKTDVTNLGSTVTTLQNNVAAYDGRISTVEGSVSSLQTTVNKITSGSGEIKTQVVETKEFTVKDGSGTQTTVINEGGITTNSVTVGGSTVINESGVTTNNVTSSNVTTNNANVSNSLTVGGKVNITENGINMGDTKITNIANGVTSDTPLSASNKNAINGADLYNETRNGATGNYIAETNTTAQNLKKLDDAIGKIDDGTVYKALNPDDSVAKNLEALDDAIKNIEVGNVETIAGNKTASSEKAAKATGANSIAIGYNTEVSGREAIGAGYGNKVTGDYSTAVGYKNEISGNNSGAFGDPNIVSGDNSYAVGNNNTINGVNNFVLGNTVTIDKDLEGNLIHDSVALGNNSTVTESNVISVGSTENKRRIVNVADGINPTDAATVGQLNSVAGQIENTIAPAMQNMQNQLGSVSNEVREVGAISAALAGLHYVEPSGEEGDKLVGAVAYGGYRGANAEAIGLAYKPSPNMMLSASTSISNGNDSQNAYNVGFSLKFGKGNTMATRAELQKQVKFVNEENRVLKTQIENLSSENAEQSSEIQALKNDKAAQDEKIKLLEKGLEELKKLMKK